MTRKMKKKLFIALAIILFLFLILVLSNILITSKIESELRKLTQQEIAPGVSVSFRDVRSSIINKKIEIEGLLITTDTADTEKISFARIEQLKLSGIKFRKFLNENEIDLREILILNPEIALYERFKLPETKKEGDTTGVESGKKIKSFRVDRFHCKGLDMISHIKGDKQKEINNVDIQIDNLVFGFEKNREEGIYFGDIKLSSDRFAMITPNGLYKLGYDEMILKDKSTHFEIRGFKLKPQYEPYRFARMVPFQTDRFDISVPELVIKDLNLAGLLTDKMIICREISIQNPVFDIFRDKNIPRDLAFYPPMPQKAIRKIPWPVKVDTFIVDNASIKYTEHEKDALSAGYVFFKPADFLITGLNNDPGIFNKEPQFNLYMTASFMGESTARAKVNFILDDSSRVKFTGTLEPIDADVFNTITVPNAGIRINSGLLEKLYFEFSGTRTKSRGEVEFFYKDLDITLLKQKEGVHKDRKFISFIAGNILRTSNSPDDRKVFLAEVQFNRDMNKGVINYIWKSILEGLKSTITPGKKDLRQIEQE